MRWFALLVVLLFSGSLVLAGGPVYRQSVYQQPVSIYQKIYVAESILVPVVVPSALLVNFSQIVAPPPVTIAPQALVEAQGQNQLMLQRMEALEKKLDLLLNQSTMPRADTVVAPRPTIQQVAGVFKQHCAQCHSGQNSRAGVVLFNEQGAYGPNVPPAVLLAAVRSDRMPKTPGKLPVEEKRLLEEWVKP